MPTKNEIINDLIRDRNIISSRIKEIALENNSDYPNVADVTPLEQLWSIESALKGTLAANGDLHAMLEILRLRCGLTKEQVVEIWDKEVWTPRTGIPLSNNSPKEIIVLEDRD